MTSEPDRPRSRRDRPAKPPLSREWIVEATLDIVRREGLENVTMRRVAQALDTGPASLYVYVANTAELHAAVLDELLGTLTVTTKGPWPGRARQLLEDYRTLLFSHRGLARSALMIRPSGKNSIALYDKLLGLLLEGGVDPARAAWGVDMLILYVTANAAEHATPEPGDIDAQEDTETERERMVRSTREADPDDAPYVARYADLILAGRPAQRWDWAVSSLLAGIAATATPPTGPDTETSTYTEEES